MWPDPPPVMTPENTWARGPQHLEHARPQFADGHVARDGLGLHVVHPLLRGAPVPLAPTREDGAAGHLDLLQPVALVGADLILVCDVCHVRPSLA
jgi:hypothetical protein